ncbi:helix-turn-helix domain-containing protein [Candidatus Nitrotoga fabula]|uniref:Transposase n=1 Tax=Candidatus Nitrotoga fabula TaxID=2182327 RepID=A0A916BCG0_9PROT|nr:hypothetical protein [Candidatus Nitrotoga fabula]CAE6696370.1 hypothetical protein NTGZN8_130232 [Candidatus Nitrotoga fabula]
MRQLELGYGVRGWQRIKRYAARIETITENAAGRLEALRFWDKHGLEAVLDFHKVSRCTLYNWRRQYLESGDKVARRSNAAPGRGQTLY